MNQTYDYTRITKDPATHPPVGVLVGFRYGGIEPEGGKPHLAMEWDGKLDANNEPLLPLSNIDVDAYGNGPLTMRASMPDWWCHLQSREARKKAEAVRHAIASPTVSEYVRTHVNELLTECGL